MLNTLGQRLAAVGSGLADTFLRGNRVIPPVLALLALLVFAWIVAGIFVGGPESNEALNEANLVQSEDPAGAEEPLAPEVENRDVESFAAFESKDPFRQLIAPPEEMTTDTTQPAPTGDTAGQNGATSPPGATSPAPGGGAPPEDSDGDGLSDEREFALGQDPFNADTDGDGILDGDEFPGGGDGDLGGGGGAGGDRGAGGDDGLFDSGGDLLLP